MKPSKKLHIRDTVDAMGNVAFMAARSAAAAATTLGCKNYTRLLVMKGWVTFAVTKRGDIETIRVATKRDKELGTRLYF